MCISMHVCMHIHVLVCACMCTCTSPWTYARVCVLAHSNTHVSLCMCLHLLICLCVHANNLYVWPVCACVSCVCTSPGGRGNRSSDWMGVGRGARMARGGAKAVSSLFGHAIFLWQSWQPHPWQLHPWQPHPWQLHLGNPMASWQPQS